MNVSPRGEGPEEGERGAARALAAPPEKTQQEQEQIDEIQVQAERAEDGVGAGLPLGQGQRHAARRPASVSFLFFGPRLVS